MPSATESVRIIGHSFTHTDGTKGGDGFEEDGVKVESGGWD